MISNIRSLNAYSYSGLSRSGGTAGKLYVPVNPSSVIYAQFSHISGIAARKGQNGVSINKIQILNTLIDNLNKIKSGNFPKADSTMNEAQAEVLIKNYQSQIRSAAETANAAPYALAGVQPQAGALFSIDV